MIFNKPHWRNTKCKEWRLLPAKADVTLASDTVLAYVKDVTITEMRHALAATRYTAVKAAEAITQETVFDQLGQVYLLGAVYVAPTLSAKHLKLSEPMLRAGLERLVKNGAVVPTPLPGYKGICYIWQG